MDDDDDSEILTVRPVESLVDNLFTGCANCNDIILLSLLYLRHLEGSSLSHVQNFVQVHQSMISEATGIHHIDSTAVAQTLAELGRRSFVCEFVREARTVSYCVTPEGIYSLLSKLDIHERVQRHDVSIMLRADCVRKIVRDSRLSLYRNQTPSCKYTNAFDVERSNSYPVITPITPNSSFMFVSNPAYRVYDCADVVLLSPSRTPQSVRVGSVSYSPSPSSRVRNGKRRRQQHSSHESEICVMCGGSTGGNWIQCDECSAWGHIGCDPSITDVYVFSDDNPSCLPYFCVGCKDHATKRTVFGRLAPRDLFLATSAFPAHSNIDVESIDDPFQF